MERIVIEGDVVALLQVQEEKTVSLKQFKEEFGKLVGIKTPILPRDCVLYVVKDGTQIILIEKEPRNFKITYKEAEYEICFPYHYFLLVFEGYAFEELMLFFRKKPLTDFNDEMLVPPLKNMVEDCRVCMGREFKFSVNGTLHNKVAKVTSYFYQSDFNDDLGMNYNNCMPQEILRELGEGEERFSAWQRLAQNGVNPCVLSWHIYKTLNEIVDELLEEGG